MSTFCSTSPDKEEQDTIVGTSTNCSAVCGTLSTRRLRERRDEDEILGTSIACSGMRISSCRHTSTCWFSICGTGTSSDGTMNVLSRICSTVRHWSRSCGLTSKSRSGPSRGWGEGGVPDRPRKVHLAPPLPCPGSPLAPQSVARHGPNITAVMKGCCQGDLQRKLLVPPVHAQPTVTTPLRFPTAVVAMHRHVDHWAKVSQKKKSTPL